MNPDSVITRYSPDKVSGFFSTLLSIIRAFPIAHALGYRLASRNIRSKYRQSVLGIFWALIPPLGNALIWVVLNQTRIVSVSGSDVANYPLYAITGTTLWSIFSISILTPIQTIQANRSILTKINFPRESLIYNAVYEIGFSACIAFIIIVLEFLYFGIPITPDTLLFLPGLVTLGLLGLALSLLILQLSMLYSDIHFALPSVIQFGMYLSPVIYVNTRFTGWASILNYNPVSPVLNFTRAKLLGMEYTGGGETVMLVFLGALLFTLVGMVIQRMTAEILIERMGN